MRRILFLPLSRKTFLTCPCVPLGTQHRAWLPGGVQEKLAEGLHCVHKGEMAFGGKQTWVQIDVFSL